MVAGPGMQDLDSWFDHQARKEQKIVRLEDALLAGRFWRYAFYRLRFFLLRYVVESAVHLVRFLFLYFIFGPGEFITIVLLLAATGLLTSFWWGSLEAMRGRIRHLRRTERPHLVSKEIGRWLSLSIQLGIATGLGTLGWIVWSLWAEGPGFKPVDLYIFAILARLTFTLVSRCYHSGIYSLRRVYRPPLAIVAVEMSGLIIAAALWPLLAAWGFSIASLLSAGIAAGITIFYTHRSYKFSGLNPLTHLHIGELRMPLIREKRDWFTSGVSYAIMRLDSILIIGLYGTALIGNGVKYTELFVLLFVFGPTVRSGFDWAQLFYFDLKKLEVGLFKNIRRRFEVEILKLSLLSLSGLFFWIVACILGTIALQTSLGVMYLLLIPFFVSRSLLAAIQIEAFSQKAYGLVIFGGLVLTIGILSAGFLLAEDIPKLVAVTLLSTFTAAVLEFLLKNFQLSGRGDNRLIPTEWLALVSAIDSPVQIGILDLSIEPGTRSNRQSSSARPGEEWKIRRLADRIAGRLGKSGSITQVFGPLLVWYELKSSRTRIDEGWLARNSGGILKSVWRSAVKGNGHLALQSANESGQLGRTLGGADLDCSPTELELETRKSFEKMFPQGIIFDPNLSDRHQLSAIPHSERRGILRESESFARDLPSIYPSSHYEITVLCPAGVLKLIFLVNRNVSQRLRASWRNRITSVNRRLSLKPPREKSTTVISKPPYESIADSLSG